MADMDIPKGVDVKNGDTLKPAPERTDGEIVNIVFPAGSGTEEERKILQSALETLRKSADVALPPGADDLLQEKYKKLEALRGTLKFLANSAQEDFSFLKIDAREQLRKNLINAPALIDDIRDSCAKTSKTVRERLKGMATLDAQQEALLQSIFDAKAVDPFPPTQRDGTPSASPDVVHSIGERYVILVSIQNELRVLVNMIAAGQQKPDILTERLLKFADQRDAYERACEDAVFPLLRKKLLGLKNPGGDTPDAPSVTDQEMKLFFQEVEKPLSAPPGENDGKFDVDVAKYLKQVHGRLTVMQQLLTKQSLASSKEDGGDIRRLMLALRRGQQFKEGEEEGIFRSTLSTMLVYLSERDEYEQLLGKDLKHGDWQKKLTQFFIFAVGLHGINSAVSQFQKPPRPPKALMSIEKQRALAQAYEQMKLKLQARGVKTVPSYEELRITMERSPLPLKEFAKNLFHLSLVDYLLFCYFMHLSGDNKLRGALEFFGMMAVGAGADMITLALERTLMSAALAAECPVIFMKLARFARSPVTLFILVVIAIFLSSEYVDKIATAIDKNIPESWWKGTGNDAIHLISFGPIFDTVSLIDGLTGGTKVGGADDSMQYMTKKMGYPMELTQNAQMWNAAVDARVGREQNGLQKQLLVLEKIDLPQHTSFGFDTPADKKKAWKDKWMQSSWVRREASKAFVTASFLRQEQKSLQDDLAKIGKTFDPFPDLVGFVIDEKTFSSSQVTIDQSLKRHLSGWETDAKTMNAFGGVNPYHNLERTIAGLTEAQCQSIPESDRKNFVEGVQKRWDKLKNEAADFGLRISVYRRDDVYDQQVWLGNGDLKEPTEFVREGWIEEVVFRAKRREILEFTKDTPVLGKIEDMTTLVSPGLAFGEADLRKILWEDLLNLGKMLEAISESIWEQPFLRDHRGDKTKMTITERGQYQQACLYARNDIASVMRAIGRLSENAKNNDEDLRRLSDAIRPAIDRIMANRDRTPTLQELEDLRKTLLRSVDQLETAKNGAWLWQPKDSEKKFWVPGFEGDVYCEGDFSKWIFTDESRKQAWDAERVIRYHFGGKFWMDASKKIDEIQGTLAPNDILLLRSKPSAGRLVSATIFSCKGSNPDKWRVFTWRVQLTIGRSPDGGNMEGFRMEPEPENLSYKQWRSMYPEYDVKFSNKFKTIIERERKREQEDRVRELKAKDEQAKKDLEKQKSEEMRIEHLKHRLELRAGVFLKTSKEDERDETYQRVIGDDVVIFKTKSHSYPIYIPDPNVQYLNSAEPDKTPAFTDEIRSPEESDAMKWVIRDRSGKMRELQVKSYSNFKNMSKKDQDLALDLLTTPFEGSPEPLRRMISLFPHQYYVHHWPESWKLGMFETTNGSYVPRAKLIGSLISPYMRCQGYGEKRKFLQALWGLLTVNGTVNKELADGIHAELTERRVGEFSMDQKPKLNFKFQEIPYSNRLEGRNVKSHYFTHNDAELRSWEQLLAARDFLLEEPHRAELPKADPYESALPRIAEFHRMLAEEAANVEKKREMYMKNRSPSVITECLWQKAWQVNPVKLSSIPSFQKSLQQYQEYADEMAVFDAQKRQFLSLRDLTKNAETFFDKREMKFSGNEELRRLLFDNVTDDKRLRERPFARLHADFFEGSDKKEFSEADFGVLNLFKDSLYALIRSAKWQLRCVDLEKRTYMKDGVRIQEYFVSGSFSSPDGTNGANAGSILLRQAAIIRADDKNIEVGLPIFSLHKAAERRFNNQFEEMKKMGQAEAEDLQKKHPVFHACLDAVSSPNTLVPIPGKEGQYVMCQQSGRIVLCKKIPPVPPADKPRMTYRVFVDWNRETSVLPHEENQDQPGKLVHVPGVSSSRAEMEARIQNASSFFRKTDKKAVIEPTQEEIAFSTLLDNALNEPSDDWFDAPSNYDGKKPLDLSGYESVRLLSRVMKSSSNREKLMGLAKRVHPDRQNEFLQRLHASDNYWSLQSQRDKTLEFEIELGLMSRMISQANQLSVPPSPLPENTEGK